MGGYARLTVCGRVGQLETLTSRAGNKYSRLSVAINEGKGEAKRTTWYDILLYGKLSEDIEKHREYYTPGRVIIACGRPASTPFVKKDGSPGVSNSVIVSELPEFVDSRPSSD